ncbi:MAG: hypothetical protein KC505_11170 [Myxococcales bacterium]|nr:hypothetical protein [Myxococcales bacterium]
MQIEFITDRERALIGQKVDSTAAVVVSSSAKESVSFGSLLVFDDEDPLMSKIPTAKNQLDKALGIALRQLHSRDYAPKSSIAVMRKGRVWVMAEKYSSPGDAVYVKFAEDGSLHFTSEKTGNALLKGAIFLEKSEGGKVPIEINFYGGAS